jgi:8-amino-7-oxononanoate synthase
MSDFYTKELNTLKQKGIFRQRILFDKNIIDCASNDYLGLSQNKDIYTKAYEKVLQQKYHSPRASALVNGYSFIHKDFEEDMARANDFEKCIVVGSGFLANIALIEALVRKGDELFLDKEFHASGILASKLIHTPPLYFEHNNYQHLETMLKKSKSNRKIIAIEGVYSMSGDLCKKEFFDIALKYNAILIIDEAHSSGVVGSKCMGIMDFYDIKPKNNFIKMGTLGKAYGSYGAYILASNEIISFLENRAKSIIYSTAISLFDISLAHQSLKYIQQNSSLLQKDIKFIQQSINKILKIKKDSLIFPFIVGDNKKVIQIQDKLKKENILVGAIRTPTVQKAIIRFTALLQNKDKMQDICFIINKYSQEAFYGK